MNKTIEDYASVEVTLAYDMVKDCYMNAIPHVIKYLNIEKDWIEHTRMYEINECHMLSLNSEENVTATFNDNGRINDDVPLEREEIVSACLIKTAMRINKTDDNNSEDLNEELIYDFILIYSFSNLVLQFSQFNLTKGILSFEFLRHAIGSLIHECIHIQQYLAITEGFEDINVYDKITEEQDNKMEEYAHANTERIFDEIDKNGNILTYIIESSLNKHLTNFDASNVKNNGWYSSKKINMLY